jgi:hypothetical protein
VPVPSFMDAKVIVSAYEELPPRRRRRLISRVAPAAAARQAGGGYSRRGLLLAYAQQLRRRRRVGQQQQQQLEQRGPPLLEWGEWKAAGRVAAGDVAVRCIWRHICSFPTRISGHGLTCVVLVVADDEERAGELVLQAAVLRPALDQDVSSASQEDQRECIVQEIETSKQAKGCLIQVLISRSAKL